MLRLHGVFAQPFARCSRNMDEFHCTNARVALNWSASVCYLPPGGARAENGHDDDSQRKGSSRSALKSAAPASTAVHLTATTAAKTEPQPSEHIPRDTQLRPMSRTLPALTVADLTRELGSRSRALAAARAIYTPRPLLDRLPADLPGVNRDVWSAFVARHPFTMPRLIDRRTTLDGTTKYELAFDDARVETVLIPARTRSTVCISSQAGCTRRCVFCATKELGFTRHLKAEEMVAQFLVARADAPAHRPAKNVVFMGMGEPMDNLDEVLHAIDVLTQSPAPQLRVEAVTVSTSGVVPGMRRFLAESRSSLALSLNATTDDVRAELMPHAKTWPIAALLDVLREAAARNPKRHTFVEYVLFDGVNDSDADADRLATLLRGLPARVNLIPYNPFPGSALRTPPADRVVAFSRRVLQQGQLCIVRWPRGREIAAACGQLVLARAGAGFSPEPLPVATC